MKQIRLGRGNDCDYIINDDSVSRNHGEIFVDDEGNVFYTDLSSTNGSTVNGIRVNDSIILNQGDVLKLGNARPVPWHHLITEKKAGTNSEIDKIRIQSKEQDAKDNKKNSNQTILIATVCAGILLLVLATYLLVNSSKSHKDTSNVAVKGSTTDEVSAGDSDIDSNGQEINKVKIPTEITHKYDCLGNDILTEATDLEEDIVNSVDINVSLNEEIEIGRQLYSGVRSNYKIISDNRSKTLTNVLNNVVRQIDSPKGFSYRIYLIESDELNAFTAGGNIFFTSEMYSFVKNQHEMAAIIGHEVAHNERGHINLQLREEKLSKLILGDVFGSDADNLRHFLTTPFNQKRESESDLYGIDYCVKAGYEPCHVIALWERMGENEGDYNDLENLSRSHPYSSRRRDCCNSHIINNYGFSCD